MYDNRKNRKEYINTVMWQAVCYVLRPCGDRIGLNCTPPEDPCVVLLVVYPGGQKKGGLPSYSGFERTKLVPASPSFTHAEVVK